MTITRGIATAAMLAGLAVGTASTTWADLPTMSGHYLYTATDPQSGRSVTSDWYFTPCGNGCASVTAGGAPLGQALWLNGQWTMEETGGIANCPDGTTVPALNDHYTWDPNTLAGAVTITNTVPACGAPAGTTETDSIQLRQAP
jgi:hypothetical protein